MTQRQPSEKGRNHTNLTGVPSLKEKRYFNVLGVLSPRRNLIGDGSLASPVKTELACGHGFEPGLNRGKTFCCIDVGDTWTASHHGFDILLGKPEEHRDLLIFDRDRRGAQARIVRACLEG